MRLPSRQLTEAFDRLVAQRLRVTLLHLCALPILVLCYWFGHIIPVPTYPGGLRIGGLVLFSTIFSWLPVVISWGG
jgi:hypothetical protein